MKIRAPKPMEEASFDLTPMIDVVLLLIIFFMFTTHFAKSQFTPMDLPKEKGEPATEELNEAAFTIDLDRTGLTSVLGEAVSVERVQEMLKADLANEQLRTSVVVRADRLCPAVHLNRLASVLMSMGVRDWKLATANEGGSGGAAAAGGGTAP